ncbi:hypothetical protein AMTR_s00101p00074760 [Amborella trichopoda]|uniref:NB-ARC domain-containing protein n=1 Tax=Amborella trichopoda TaxID=13333 RepID=W1NWI6_AMBTC|nr:hypothetical protein AMTR_s00101p00074760 [Amborella trichopoda]
MDQAPPLLTEMPTTLVTDLPTVKPLAHEDVKECAGMLLAIITVGRAMRGRGNVLVWKDALRALRQPTMEIHGREPQVFRPLKYSYKRLEGHTLIEKLIDSSMIEKVLENDDKVKLHDEIRDVAIRTTSSEDGRKFCGGSANGTAGSQKRWRMGEIKNLEDIPESFIGPMEALKVLDINDTGSTHCQNRYPTCTISVSYRTA